jgi:hypothetical protein
VKNDIRIIAERMIREGVQVPVISRVLGGYVSRRWLYELKRTIV